MGAPLWLHPALHIWSAESRPDLDAEHPFFNRLQHIAWHVSVQSNMTISSKFLLRGSLWTIGAFGLGQAIRILTSVVLARLLAPELFGVILIVSSLRTGIELLSDVGIAQNITYHKDAN